MTAKVPSSCHPDRYLTQDTLQELFDDFKASLATDRSDAFVFASLVNNVRMAYKDPLLEACETLLQKSEDHARQLAELKLERKEAPGIQIRACPLEAAVSNTEDQVTKATPSDHPGYIWPEILENTFALYIFSSQNHHRRDWAQWQAEYTDQDSDEWDLRMILKVFKFEEPGLVKILVMTNTSPRRMLVVRDNSGLHKLQWVENIHFWAYDKPKPGTRRVWSGFRIGPWRGILGIGDEKEMGDWEKKCEFWVPV